MTSEKFCLKASILKTSIVIFGIKNTLDFKRLFSGPARRSLFSLEKVLAIPLIQIMITWHFHEMLTGDVKFQRKIYWDQNNAVWRSLTSSSLILIPTLHHKLFPLSFDSVTLIISMICQWSHCHISLFVLFSCSRWIKHGKTEKTSVSIEPSKRRRRLVKVEFYGLCTSSPLYFFQ